MGQDRRMARWILLLSLVLSGCVIEPLELSDKECPCAEGYVCDASTNRCMTTATQDCKATVEGFRPVWSTANVIRWEWTPVGDPASFVRYELEIAETREQLGTDEARVIGAEENPELGAYRLPRTGSSQDVVTGTHSYDHDPNTSYVARLLVTDTSSCVFRSELGTKSTLLRPIDPFVLYSGPRPEPGSVVPTSVSVVEDGAGGFASEYRPGTDPACIEDGRGVCSENIEWRRLGVDVSALTEGQFTTTGSLEVVMTNATDAPSFYARVWLRVDDVLYRYEPITIPPTRRRLQVPLRELRDDAGVPLSHEQLQTAPVDGVNLGGQWSRCAPDEPGDPTDCVEGRVLFHSAAIHY